MALRLDELIQELLPKRRFASVALTSGHEAVAALVCALTAVVAAAGQCVAVGAPTDGYIVLPPLSFWGLSTEGERWAERELRKILSRLSCGKVGVAPPQIYDGADIINLAERPPMK